jgi:predicted AlkP superfamily phosphohydrolase/phosphomutase
MAGLLASAAIASACRSASRASVPRVIVLGFDGLDFALTRDLMAQGRLPNFARLAARGVFAPLGTSLPPQSPVAWSNFITGLDPGAHGIFDFVHRDPKTMTPYLSTTRTEPGRHAISIGKWRFPLTGGRVELLRTGEPFWAPLGARGIASTIIRMPANFPPSGDATRELSGMGTPDLRGTYGEFSLYTSDPSRFGATRESFLRVLDSKSSVVRGVLEGPDQPYLTTPTKTRTEFVAYLDSSRQRAKVVVGDEERVLRAGEWSDWVPLSFHVSPMQTVRAQALFYLKQLTPHVELYVSPINLDPFDPALPISTPRSFATELARTTGRYYTQGMPEDTKALKTGALTVDEFLAQSSIAFTENRRQFRYVLDRFETGVLFYYFGTVDLVSHMLWRSLDPEHPAYNAAADGPHADVIPQLYVECDVIVADVLSRIGPDDLVVVMSDHGFASWRRSFNLNTWLRDHGYLSAVGRGRADAPGVWGDVDVARSKAYGLGLNGLYLNMKGREGFGTVDAAARDSLLSEISDKLLHTIDPATGRSPVAHVFRREQVYSSAGHDDIAPDLVIGYAKGTRVSDDSALGLIATDVLTDNTSAWTGDHCMDPDSVPGILLSSRALQKPAPSLQALASAILAELGVTGFPKR